MVGGDESTAQWRPPILYFVYDIGSKFEAIVRFANIFSESNV